MRRRSLVLLGALAAAPLHAGSWTHVLTTDNQAEVDVDLGTMERAEGRRRVWVRWDYGKVRTEPAHLLVYRQDIDCGDRSSRTLSSKLVKADGTVMLADDEPRDYTPAEPGSVNDEVAKAVCAAPAR